MILKLFEYASRLKINFSKSETSEKCPLIPAPNFGKSIVDNFK